jgi:outer membrane lipoprotein SlyB
MNRFAKISAAAAIALAAGTISASAACNNDASTETVLGAGSGALVGGLASHSIVGAAVGGVAGGLIGNTIGHSNNRADCRRDARARAAARHNAHDAYYIDKYGKRHYY